MSRDRRIHRRSDEPAEQQIISSCSISCRSDAPRRRPATAAPSAASGGSRAGRCRNTGRRTRPRVPPKRHSSHLPNHQQRMIRSDPILQIHVREQLARPLVRPAHHHLGQSPRPTVNHATAAQTIPFSTACLRSCDQPVENRRANRFASPIKLLQKRQGQGYGMPAQGTESASRILCHPGQHRQVVALAGLPVYKTTASSNSVPTGGISK